MTSSRLVETYVSKELAANSLWWQNRAAETSGLYTAPSPPLHCQIRMFLLLFLFDASLPSLFSGFSVRTLCHRLACWIVSFSPLPVHYPAFSCATYIIRSEDGGNTVVPKVDKTLSVCATPYTVTRRSKLIIGRKFTRHETVVQYCLGIIEQIC